MLKPRHFIILILTIPFLINNVCFAQADAGVKKKEFKNTISYNLTNTLIFGGKAYAVCYERTIGQHQSFTVEVGSLSLPKFSVLPSSIKSNAESTQSGFKFSADYRFYPANENKYNSPRGVYFAPYYSYNYFDRKNSFIIDTSSTGVSAEVGVSTDFSLSINTVGAELGYQFVFWKRLALDLILIGPGLSKYSIKTKLDTTLEAEDESELFKAINDAISDKIPGYSLVIESGEFKRSGSANTTTIGFRYLVHIGFRF